VRRAHQNAASSSATISRTIRNARLGDVLDGPVAIIVDHPHRLLIREVVVQELGGDVVLEHLASSTPRCVSCIASLAAHSMCSAPVGSRTSIAIRASLALRSPLGIRRNPQRPRTFPATGRGGRLVVALLATGDATGRRER
jgi:hypothetical protein